MLFWARAISAESVTPLRCHSEAFVAKASTSALRSTSPLASARRTIANWFTGVSCEWRAARAKSVIKRFASPPSAEGAVAAVAPLGMTLTRVGMFDGSAQLHRPYEFITHMRLSRATSALAYSAFAVGNDSSRPLNTGDSVRTESCDGHLSLVARRCARLEQHH